jgi:sugar phosphate isomerase/epimerase
MDAKLKKGNLILCYNTNGFYHHTLEDATRIIADLGYGGIALTPDVHHLNPHRGTFDDLTAYKELIDRLGLSIVIETGARYILDPSRKHYPSLLTPGRGDERLQFLSRCLEIARHLGASVLSFHSGCLEEGTSHEEGRTKLARFVRFLADECDALGIRLAIEPEPGMFIESMKDYEKLMAECGESNCALTLDVGHVHITEGEPLDAVIRAQARKIVNVHIDDARGSRHEHLPLGEGEIDFEPALRALQEIGHPLYLSVELSRHGHDAVEQARRSFTFLGKYL